MQSNPARGSLVKRRQESHFSCGFAACTCASQIKHEPALRLDGVGSWFVLCGVIKAVVCADHKYP